MRPREVQVSLPQTGSATGHELAGHLVLVVEDDYFIAEEICTALRRTGAAVIGPAPDVEQGRLLIAEQRLDCAVLDVNLHGEHVFQLAGELRARGVPSIFATGYEASFLPLAFRDAIYLQKPIDLIALVRAVKRSAGSHRSQHN
jgi:DNA-binding response OmpR family regulator